MLVRRDPTTTFLLMSVDKIHPDALRNTEITYAVYPIQIKTYSVMHDMQP